VKIDLDLAELRRERGKLEKITDVANSARSYLRVVAKPL
jgi:hypothetical protein